ncbi:substrate-binding domain-containing protein [Lachnoanaerobaculum sp. Marseille-Q4761]|uniref:LacI family DNA-binding transcriptional regulator n=1 Tax=Lachnoanaerobaculum sp. Marseille-Q4761 TaxID=2819511 RepID=UPI001AA12D72|nr:LacI family DNA-binding transcriptional regulator [Lachnoanaerobaculum sp. Marseille-Q4761]MBO1871017.1 substrate-binding domain-containing protein [Lachnoanaerobaculum sp. Marseille-Q4761]
MKKASGKVTIKDISKELGISAVSVHRALRGKEGISDELRSKIIETANEMGYVENYAAASIKRKTQRVAVVLPKDKWEKKIYFDYLWLGINKGADELKGLNIEISPFVCDNEEMQLEQLKEIAKMGPGEYGGVITISFTRAAEVLMQFQSMLARDMKVLVIDDHIEIPEGLISIPPREVQVGKVAAELAGLITSDKGRLLVSCGRTDSKIHANRLESFCNYIKENKPGLTIELITGYTRNMDHRGELYKNACEALDKYSDICLMYALTSHDNRAFVEALEKQGKNKNVAIIGTDLNEETLEFLKQKKMSAVIDQNPYEKGYMAFKIMVDCLIKNISVPDVIPCRIDIALENNADLYMD